MTEGNIKKRNPNASKSSSGHDSGLYQTVRRDIRTLQHAAENTTSDKWITIRRSVTSGKFVDAKK